jgi:NTE family protein
MLRMGTHYVSLIIHILRKIHKNSLFTLFLFSLTLICESQDVYKRPKTGLVLSGGGAHGIAHLGVIKVMEEAGLRPDFITGVSMGAIVGGLYSLGYTADSLYKLLKLVDWTTILSNKISENKVVFLEKTNFYHSIISLPLTSKKVVLPAGLITGQQFENTLSFYTWPAADINDFSKLPIPFMCLASDIVAFKKVDLRTGYLADALRASSAVPSIFTPIKIDNLLLLDGGLIRNFAAQEARDMGADFIIGSYCGFHAYNEDELQSASGIMKQIGLSRSLEDFKQQKGLVDVLIEPETHKFPINEFDNVDSLFQKGYEAALPFKQYFLKLADSLNRISSQRPIENILNKRFYKFNKIEITGNKIYTDSQIKGVLDIEPEKDVDKYLLSDRIELLYGKAWFDKVKYRIVPRNDSLILFIDCIEKPQAMFYGSVHYDNALLSGLILELSVKNLLTPRSVINFNSFIGHYFRFEFNSIQFLDRNQKFGLSANFYSDNTLIPMLELNGEKIDVISRNFVPGLSVNKSLGLNHMMSIYANFENTNLIPHYSSDDRLKSLTFNYISGTYDYQINTINTKHFPDKGVIFYISGSTSKLISAIARTDTVKTTFKEDGNGDLRFERFYTLHGSFNQYFSPSGKLTFSIRGEAFMITNSDSVSAQNNFYLLGGIEPVSKRSIAMAGFHSNEIPVRKAAGISTEIDFELIRDIHLTAMADIFTVREANRSDGYSLLSGYGIGVGYMSIIGPIKVGIMHGNYSREEYFNKTKGFLSIGYKF